MKTFLYCSVALLLCGWLAGCSLAMGPTDETALRAEYANKTASQSPTNLYTQTVLINVAVGGTSQALPGLHLPGLLVDVGVLAYYFDELIYGTGAIIAREKSCPTLVEKVDYWNIMGAWFSGVRTSQEFETALGLGAALTPLVTRDKAVQIFANAVHMHGAKFVGAKLAGLIAAKMTAKGLAGFVPVLGPIVAAGINWFILSGINDASRAYYETKARTVCKP